MLRNWIWVPALLVVACAKPEPTCENAWKHMVELGVEKEEAVKADIARCKDISPPPTQTNACVLDAKTGADAQKCFPTATVPAAPK
jgi:hypothetical protein